MFWWINKWLTERASKFTITSVKCIQCTANIFLSVPKKGYENYAGRCCVCGYEFIALSNYGLVTLFPRHFFDDHTFEELFGITKLEAHEIIESKK